MGVKNIRGTQNTILHGSKKMDPTTFPSRGAAAEAVAAMPCTPAVAGRNVSSAFSPILRVFLYNVVRRELVAGAPVGAASLLSPAPAAFASLIQLANVSLLGESSLPQALIMTFSCGENATR